MEFRRWTQTFSLTVFLFLLISSVGGYFTALAVDFFLRLDPSIILITAVSIPVFLLGFLPALVIMMLSIILGRFFCGHICPMGTTLDVADKTFGVPYKKRKDLNWLKPAKYLVLSFLMTSAILGVSQVFLASPISLITRFYGLIIIPILKFVGIEGHQLLMPVWEKLDFSSLLFLQIKPVRYATQFFIFLFFSLLFILPRLTPRFWCRYLCPAGAILALFSFKPLIRRQVNANCNDCGKCVRKCDMGAIPENDPTKTSFSECVVCLTCEKVCPETAITFSQAKKANNITQPLALPSRRQFITAGAAGATTAVLSLSGLNAATGKTGEGQVLPESLVRPPASLPELEFLSRCVRCAECVAACPTNTLQPIWFEAGTLALFSPAMKLRRGYCDPDCHRCAAVCPTEAIKQVSKEERIWAKTGTAVINRQKCLAWEQNQKCMVCDETCPFGAIEFTHEPGLSVTVPKVQEHKCSGCGYCEYHCPVQHRAAITISPMNALRIDTGSYQEVGEKNGLVISRKVKESTPEYPGSQGSESNSAPGFDSGNSDLPPGFSE